MQRIRSDWAEAQSDLSIHFVYTLFVMSWLVYIWNVNDSFSVLLGC